MATRGIAAAFLAAWGGVAVADVTVSGDARMGIVFDSSADPRFSFAKRIRVQLNARGVTDGGVEYGVNLRLDEAGAAARGAGGSVSVSTGGHRLSFGDVPSADRSVMGDDFTSWRNRRPLR